MNDYVVLIVTVLASASVAQLTIPPLAALCRRRGWLDHPGPRKLHTSPTPRLTGIALYLATWSLLVAAAVVFPERMHEVQDAGPRVVAGSIIILLLGIVDDLRPLSGWIKLVTQAAVGSWLFWGGVGFDRVWIPFVGGLPLGYFSLPFTLVWFLVVLNSINIIDGLDGLAAGTTAIGAVTLIWVGMTIHLPPLWIGAAALFGGLLIFWRYNRPPAKVFMGDSGSLSLGYFFAVAALFAPIKRFTALAFFVPILSLLIPVIESALSFVRRVVVGGNPLRADAGHLHHRLLEAGWTKGQVLIAYYLAALILGGFSVGFRYGNRRFLAILLGIFVLSLLFGLAIILKRRKPDMNSQPT